MTLNTADKIRDKISTTKTEMMKEKLTLVCLLNVKQFITQNKDITLWKAYNYFLY